MREQEEILNDIECILKNHMAVYVFGTGKVATGIGKKLLKTIGIQVNFYCDNNEKKWGNPIDENIICISPDEIKEKKNKACIIMVGQFDQKSIYNQAKALGFDLILTYSEICSLDSIVDQYISCSEKITEQEFYQTRIQTLEKEKDVICYQIPNPSNKKIAIYTCISGGYDDPVEPTVISDQCDYYLISEEKPKNLKVFQWINIKDVVPSYVEDYPRQNRFCKINGNQIFSNYDFSIYIDGNIKITGDIEPYIGKIGRFGIATHLHCANDCLYVEALRVMAVKIEDEKLARMQMMYYKEKGMPRNYGNFQNGILVRENRNIVCKKIMEDWWKEVYTKSHRDQFSLTYCLWKNGVRSKDIGVIGSNIRENKECKIIKRHHL